MIDLLEVLSEWVLFGGLVCGGAGFMLIFVLIGALGGPVEPGSVGDWLATGGFSAAMIGCFVVVGSVLAPLTTTAVVFVLIAASSTGLSALAGWYSGRRLRLRREELRAERLRYDESFAALSGEIYRVLTATREGGEPLTDEQRAVIKEYAELRADASKRPVGERERVERLHDLLSAGATVEATAEDELREAQRR